MSPELWGQLIPALVILILAVAGYLKANSNHQENIANQQEIKAKLDSLTDKPK